jgi:lysophospholipase L1-like esterase
VPQPFITRDFERWVETRAHDPLLFWRLRPDVHLDGVPFTNNLGLRPPDVTAKAPGEFRVLSLGESSTFARHVLPSANYSALLEEHLQRASRRGVRVINAGVPGYTLFQGRVYLEHRGLGLDPDAVLLYFGFNDFLPVSTRQKRDASAGAESQALTDRELYDARERWWARAGSMLLEHSNLFRIVAAGESLRPEDVAPDYSKRRVPDHDRRQVLEEVRALCEAEGLLLALAVPWYREFEEHAPLLREFAAAHDVPLIDLPKELHRLPRPRAEYFLDELHPTAEGHRAIAAVLERVLAPRWARVP